MILANGQLAATSGTLLAGSATPTADRRVNVRLYNGGTTSETVVLTIATGTGTARGVDRCVLAAKELRVVPGLSVGPNDLLAGSTTNATTVDYTVDDALSVTEAPVTYDASGSRKTAATTTGFRPVCATVAALGTNQATAAPVAVGFTLVTAADGTVGVILPSPSAGDICIIKNIDVANAILKVYPPTSGTINALSANSAISLAAKVSAMFVAYNATTWYTLPLLPS